MTEIDLALVQDVIEKHGLRRKSRRQELVWKRYAFYKFMRDNTRLTLEDIGRLCGGKDHATVHHGIKKYNIGMKYDDLRQIMSSVEMDLETTVMHKCDFNFNYIDVAVCLANLETLIKEKL